MKGFTKIQMINPKTGHVDKTYKDENIITKAISNAFYIPVTMLRNNPNTVVNWQNNLFPPNRNSLGGILLWDDTIEENEEIVYPPDNVRNIGYAGGPYSGSNTLRGTLNSSETGAIPGGYRNVWDFDTSKCNAVTIKALTLTHVNCGNNGFGTNENILASSAGASQSQSVFIKHDMYHRALGYIDDGLDKKEDCSVMLSAFFSATTSITTYKQRKVNFSRVLINDVAPSTNTAAYNTTVIELPSNSSYRRLKNTYMIDNIIHIITYVSKNSFEHIRINRTDNSVTREVIVCSGLSSDLNVDSAMLFDTNEYLIMLYNGDVVKLSSQGTFLRKVHMLAWGIEWCFNKYMGKYFAAYYANGSSNYNLIQIIDDDDLTNNRRMVTTESMHSYGKIIDSPLRYPSFLSDSGSPYIHVCMNNINYYLASINNLSIPITKTSSYNMKITYDILDG